MSSERSSEKESNTFLKHLLALLLILGCLWASQWQFQRGIDRQDRNQGIESQLTLSPVELRDIKEGFVKFEWRTVTAQGSFDPTNQILLKNRYFEGVYGYEVLTRFTTADSRSFWVDRGWVAAVGDATEIPRPPAPPGGTIEIVGYPSRLPTGPQAFHFASRTLSLFANSQTFCFVIVIAEITCQFKLIQNLCNR